MVSIIYQLFRMIIAFELRMLMFTMIAMQISNNYQMDFTSLSSPRIGITEQKEDAVSYISV